MRNLRWLAALLILATGCIIGKVEAVIDDQGTTVPVQNASMYFRECPTCSWRYMGQTDADGYYWYDAYADGVVMPSGPTDTYELRVSSAQYDGEPPIVYHKPDWQLYAVTSEYYTLVPTVYLYDPHSTSISPIFMQDFDEDGVSDAAEVYVHETQILDPDTDNDGLSDGAEIYGMDSVDYAGLGANPNHKDAFFEVDYKVANGLGGFPTPGILQALVDLFEEGLPGVWNPDYDDGIAIHLVKDTNLGSSFACDTSTSHWLTRYPQHSDEYRKGMRYLQLCNGVYGGVANFPHIGYLNEGTQLVVEANWDQISSNDQTEAGLPSGIGVLAHEIGHTMWLSHGGGDEGGVNAKANYPSLMNYSFVSGVCPYAQSNTLPTHCLQFSDGRLETLDENAIDEVMPFTSNGYQAHLLAYTSSPPGQFPNPVVPQRWDVDWSRNGTIDATPWASGGMYRLGGPPELLKLRDYDDFTALEEGMQDGIALYSPYYDASTGEYGTLMRLRGNLEPTQWETPGDGDYCGATGCNLGVLFPGFTDEPFIKEQGPPTKTGLSGADEAILSRFAKRTGGALRTLLDRVGLDGAAASRLASMLYRQDRYLGNDEEKRRASLTARLSREAGEHVAVEFIDCVGPDETEIGRLLRGEATGRGDRAALQDVLKKQRQVQLCR